MWLEEQRAQSPTRQASVSPRPPQSTSLFNPSAAAPQMQRALSIPHRAAGGAAVLTLLSCLQLAHFFGSCRPKNRLSSRGGGGASEEAAVARPCPPACSSPCRLPPPSSWFTGSCSARRRWWERRGGGRHRPSRPLLPHAAGGTYSMRPTSAAARSAPSMPRPFISVMFRSWICNFPLSC